MLKLVRSNAHNADFVKLVEALDASLAISDGDQHGFYDQYNKLDNIHHTVVAYHNERPVACGAIKQFSTAAMEIKRMFTIQNARGKGLATTVLSELEKWAVELGNKTLVLETGKKQPEAVALYLKCNYKITENYGQYIGVENSVCFRKEIK